MIFNFVVYYEQIWVLEAKTTPRGLYNFFSVSYAPIYGKIGRKCSQKAICGARGGRTLTVSPPADFKSAASANSATAPTGVLYNLFMVMSIAGKEMDPEGG